MAPKGRPEGTPWYVRLSMDELAEFYGVPRKTIEKWRLEGCVELHKHAYDLREINKWFVVAKGINASADGRRNAEVVRGMAELKQMQLKQGVRAAEVKYAKDIKKLVPLIWVDQLMDRIRMVLQRAGENLRRYHGDEAQKELHDAIGDIVDAISTMWAEHELPGEPESTKPLEPVKAKRKRKPAKKKVTKKAKVK